MPVSGKEKVSSPLSQRLSDATGPKKPGTPDRVFEGLVAPQSGSPGDREALLAYHVLPVELVLADAFDQFGVGQQIERQVHRPGHRESLDVVECDLQVQVTEVAAPKSFRRPQCVAVRQTAVVHPRLIVESHRVDDEYVAIPATDGVAKPRGLRILGKRP